MRHTATSVSFDGKHTLEYTDTGKTHIYRLDGKRVPGSTGVSTAYPKGEGLIRWMVQQGIEEYDNKNKMKKAARIGKVIHKYAEATLKGETFNWELVDAEEDKHIIYDCIHQFDNEIRTKHPDDKLYAAEILVGSPSLMAATQIDAVIIRDNDIITRDYKTGKKIYISALHQTVLGRIMLREWLNINSNKLEIMKFSKDPGTRPFEWCVVDNGGLTLNGTRMEYAGLLDELEAQTTRNVQTFRHIHGVEKLLTKYYRTEK